MQRNHRMKRKTITNMIPEKLGSFLHHCTKTNAFRAGLSLHAVTIKTGMQADILIANHVLNFYAKRGSVESARHLFDEMPQRNLVTWSALISGYDQSRKPDSALELFLQMLKHHGPNEFVFASALSSCSSIRDLILGKQIHVQTLKSGHASSFVRSSLIMLYMNCGRCDDASLIVTESKPNSLTLVSYNVAISGMVKNRQQEKAIEMLTAMNRHGLVPDRFTFAGLLGSGEPIYDISVIIQLHCQMVKLGLDRAAFSGNVLIMLYSRFNLIMESEKMFRAIENRDTVSWNTAVSVFHRSEENSKALSVFREMVMENNVSPDDLTYTIVLSAAADLASVRNGQEIHGHLIRTGPDWSISVWNSLMNMYAKSGSLDPAKAIFERMEARNLISWNTIIAAFSYHGFSTRAFALFEEMMMTGLSPDSVTFLELLTACNHSGLVNEGRGIFNSMVEVHGIAPNVEHLGCLVDLLGRVGKINEAEEIVREYSIGDDGVVLGSLLSACRLHGGVIDGEQIGKKLLELGPASTSPYVMLSSLYASNGMWECVRGTRETLRVSGLKKEIGQSVVGDMVC